MADRQSFGGGWRSRRAARVVAAAGLLLLLAGLLWVVYKGPPWLVHQEHLRLKPNDEAARISDERRNLLAILAGIGAALTLWYTHQRQELDRDQNRTTRYTAAIEQLGSEKLEVRLGGIYALE
ncbi:MAG: hypothetical protein ACJ74O_18950 [Frankiaceae bacterium]